MVKNDFKTVDEYIQSFPKKTQVHLKSIIEILAKGCVHFESILLK
jgi:hypothetical protein